MVILFSLIVMRMTGAVAFNPIFGRTNIPARAKAAFIFSLALMLYLAQGGVLPKEPATLLEYGVMLVSELFFGFVTGFSIELAFLVVQYASAVMDFVMGLSMAQIYDPQYNTQMTVTNGLFYAFFMLLFLSLNGHIWLVGLFFKSARQVPFGQVAVSPVMAEYILEMFQDAIYMGVQFAFPMIAMELVTEAAVGILMKIIPQINVFSVNFQIKLMVGIWMLLYLFGPMSDQLYGLAGTLKQWAEGLAGLF